MDLHQLINPQELEAIQELSKRTEWGALLTLFRNWREMAVNQLIGFKDTNDALKNQGYLQATQFINEALKELNSNQPKVKYGTGRTLGTAANPTGRDFDESNTTNFT